MEGFLPALLQAEVSVLLVFYTEWIYQREALHPGHEALDPLTQNLLSKVLLSSTS